MARIDFPSNPSNGQTLTVTVAGANTVYTYNATYGVWRASGSIATSSSSGASVTTSNTAPSGPSSGDLWWNSMDGNMYVYYNDGDSNQWVQSNPAQPGPAGSAGPAGASANLTSISSNLVPSANVTYDIGTSASSWKDLYLSGNSIYLAGAQISKNASGGIDLPSGSKVGGTDIGTGSGGTSVTVYSSNSAFPTTGNTRGDFAFANNTSTLHVWDGSTWDVISHGVDESPIITTEPASSFNLNNDGTSSNLTMVATDPEGFDIAYGIAYNTSGSSLPSQLASSTTVNSNGVYTFSPTSNTNLAGSFKARLSASDGARTVTRLVDVSLAFAAAVDYLVVAGGGAGGGTTNGAGEGGGGAGGLIYSTAATFDSGTTYTITVGAGGSTTTDRGNPGDNSVISGTGFTTVTAIGGGGGGGGLSSGRTGGAGGSGGGGSYNSSSAGGAGTPGQGYPGGSGLGSSPYPAGGGGGAGGAGVNGASGEGGDGGPGLYYSISGANTAYAGGGGGGSRSDVGDGGVGGGGSGGSPGTDGLGGGGGGMTNENNPVGAGGSGVVILRTLSSAASTTGSPTVTTDGSYNIYTFTGSGTITF